jgi:hypothetical protein
MCRSPKSSREHVPPLNLFPEAREMGGKDYRVNLITVPSCDLHNAAKSHDDEFLMVSLAGIIGNNSIGYLHKLGKVDRALRGSARHLLDEVLLKKNEVHTIELSPNKYIDVIWGTPDVARLHRCFDHIARGLHFNHFGKAFTGAVHILLGYLLHKEQNLKSWSELIRNRTEIDLQGKPKKGSNADVFYYQVTDADKDGLFLIKLCFYGGLNVYAAFWPETASPPSNLLGELISRGIPTVISLEEKSYQFNTSAETQPFLAPDSPSAASGEFKR